MSNKKIRSFVLTFLLLLALSSPVYAASGSNQTEVGYTTSTIATIPSGKPTIPGGTPTTGDDIYIKKYIIALGISVSAITCIILLKRKEDKKGRGDKDRLYK